MKIVFFGTPDYVLPIANSLYKNFLHKDGSGVVGVVTKHPKPVGREQFINYSPVDDWAHKKNVPKFFEPNDININNIRADIGILASYSQIIPKNVINYFPYGIINIHPSLLPSFRGASPVQATILTSHTPGLTFLKMDEKLDHGPIISQFKDEIKPEDTNETLRNRLFERAAEILPGLLTAYTSGKTRLSPQDESLATYTYEIKREDGFIPPQYLSHSFKGKPLKGAWEIPFILSGKKSKKTGEITKEPLSVKANVQTINNFIKAMSPWPGAWSMVRIKNQELRIKILKAHLESLSTILILDVVQLEGKNPVSWDQFLQGYPEAEFT